MGQTGSQRGDAAMAVQKFQNSFDRVGSVLLLALGVLAGAAMLVA